MKFFIVIMMLFGNDVSADPLQPGVLQRNASDTGTINRFMPVPSANALFFYNKTTNLPEMVLVGPGLNYSSGTLSANGVGQVQTDWNATSGLGQLLNKPSLSVVAVSGSYVDLIDKPSAFPSNWGLVGGKPSFSAVATSGAYSDLSGAPVLAVVATSGSYLDLSNRPTIPAAQVNSDWNAVSGAAQILNKPSIPAAQVQSDWNASSGLGVILNKPTQVSTFTNDANYVTSSALGTALASYVTNASLASTLSGYATTSALTSGLAGKFNTPTGTTAQYVRGDGSLATLPTASARSFGNPARSLNAAFQISSTRDSFVVYTVDVSVTSLLLAGTSGRVFLEYADDNAITTNVVIVNSTPNATGGVLNVTNLGPGNVTGMIPAGKFVRIRTQNVTGTPTFTFQQSQEVLL